MAKLIFLTPEFAGRVHELAEGTTTVGRSSDNLLVLSDPSVSAGHGEILVHGPEVIVRDLGSRNGTVVEGRRLVHGQTQVLSGQVVRFGRVEVRLELDPPAWTDPETAVTAFHLLDRKTPVRPANP